MPEYVENEFYDYLKNMNLNELKLYAIREGSVVFPRIPIMRLEGPLPIVQLLETTLLVLVNYARLKNFKEKVSCNLLKCNYLLLFLKFGNYKCSSISFSSWPEKRSSRVWP